MDASEDQKPRIGQEAWIGADSHIEDSDYYRRAMSFVKEINWEEVTRICSDKRDGVPCSIAENYSIGVFNMVRQVVFQDGELWVARLRLPALEPEGKEEKDIAREISSEVASMKYLESHSNIPVPKVYHFETASDNTVGVPYILMQYIHGSVAAEVRRSKGCARGLFGTPDQDRKFRKQMASIQAELASILFDRIGFLYQDPESGDFYIGSDPRMKKGPWETAADYYNDLADHNIEVVGMSSEELQDDPSFSLPILFKELMLRYSIKELGRGPFGLANTDLGAHNLLVNEDFDIVGMIDLDGLMAAPIEIQAQFPVLTGLDMEIPYYVTTKPMAIERITETRPKLIEYKQLLQECERAVREESGLAVRPGEIMMSKAAVIYLGIFYYNMCLPDTNRRWMQAYSLLLRDHIARKREN